MELIIPFKKSDFTPDSEHFSSGKIIFEIQKDWEESFHSKFNPIYANVIEDHPLAMQRLTVYNDLGESTNNDFGMANDGIVVLIQHPFCGSLNITTKCYKDFQHDNASLEFEP